MWEHKNDKTKQKHENHKYYKVHVTDLQNVYR